MRLSAMMVEGSKFEITQERGKFNRLRLATHQCSHSSLLPRCQISQAPHDVAWRFISPDAR